MNDMGSRDDRSMMPGVGVRRRQHACSRRERGGGEDDVYSPLFCLYTSTPVRTTAVLAARCILSSLRSAASSLVEGGGPS